MKQAIVLHGYKGSPYVNWYPWLAWKLRHRGYKTWTPKLPQSNYPNGRVWTRKLLKKKDWDFSGNLLIGHSAGSIEILNLLSNLPKGQKAGTVVLVSALRVKPEWRRLRDLIPEPLNFNVVQKNAERFIIVHGADDPTVPAADAKYYADKLDGELVVLPGGHFNILKDIKFWRFPELIDLLDKRQVL